MIDDFTDLMTNLSFDIPNGLVRVPIKGGKGGQLPQTLPKHVTILQILILLIESTGYFGATM